MDLSPEILAKFERLIASRIQLLPSVEAGRHLLFERDGFVALVERRDNGFGNIGAAGILIEERFAALVYRAGDAYFMAKDIEVKATPEQVSALRTFQADLERALGRT